MLFTIRRHHRYDEQNRRIEISFNTALNDTDLQTFTYNDYEDVIATIPESSHADHDFGEEGAYTKTGYHSLASLEPQFRYQYDPHGNWIEKTAETPGGPIWSLERRTISYFE